MSPSLTWPYFLLHLGCPFLTYFTEKLFTVQCDCRNWSWDEKHVQCECDFSDSIKLRFNCFGLTMHKILGELKPPITEDSGPWWLSRRRKKGRETSLPPSFLPQAALTLFREPKDFAVGMKNAECSRWTQWLTQTSTMSNDFILYSPFTAYVFSPQVPQGERSAQKSKWPVRFQTRLPLALWFNIMQIVLSKKSNHGWMKMHHKLKTEV